MRHYGCIWKIPRSRFCPVTARRKEYSYTGVHQQIEAERKIIPRTEIRHASPPKITCEIFIRIRWDSPRVTWINTARYTCQNSCTTDSNAWNAMLFYPLKYAQWCLSKFYRHSTPPICEMHSAAARLKIPTVFRRTYNKQDNSSFNFKNSDGKRGPGNFMLKILRSRDRWTLFVLKVH